MIELFTYKLISRRVSEHFPAVSNEAVEGVSDWPSLLPECFSAHPDGRSRMKDILALSVGKRHISKAGESLRRVNSVVGSHCSSPPNQSRSLD